MPLEAEPAEIRRRLEDVQRRISAAARRAGRDSAGVALVVVTKGHSLQTVRATYTAGVRRFGENRVEELSAKVDSLRDLPAVEWHLVGHLQGRKAGDLPPDVTLVHSVDRSKIARRLSEVGLGKGRPLDVLLECNMSGEVSKQGWPLDNAETWQRVLPEWERVCRLPGLRVLGLMTMAPLAADLERQRAVFRALRDLRDFACQRLGLAWPHLSMGMSDDFEAAVEEGATLVRVGRAILGERPLAREGG